MFRVNFGGGIPEDLIERLKPGQRVTVTMEVTIEDRHESDEGHNSVSGMVTDFQIGNVRPANGQSEFVRTGMLISSKTHGVMG